MHCETQLTLSVLLLIGFVACQWPESDEFLSEGKYRNKAGNDLKYRDKAGNDLKGRNKAENELMYRNESGNCECGVSQGSIFAGKDDGKLRVINGDIVQPINKYPWMIAIEQDYKHHCGAAILNERYVLTAAHCVADLAEKVYPRHTNCFELRDGKIYCSIPLHKIRLKYLEPSSKKEKYMKISFAKFLADYSTPSHNYDIALLKTESMLPCNHLTAPICLPDPAFSYKVTTGTVAGWGHATVGAKDKPGEILREAKLRIATDSKTCKKNITTKHFCGLGKSQNSCYGDSGGPLFTEQNGRNYVFGISSHGISEECNPDFPEFYTKVSEFLPWIKKNINSKTNQNERDDIQIIE